MDPGLGVPPSLYRPIHRRHLKQQQNTAPPPTFPPPVYQDTGPYGKHNSQPQPYYQQSGFPPQGYPPQGLPPQQAQQGMHYQQQPNGPPQGYYANTNGYNRGGRGGTDAGLCAALAASLACCCCLDFSLL